ncbi:unnamed protein product [Allacma fusca]|uniref:Uncharacterized protein n=1 Tax=Allacma fusca TaxID=39272 RepID=A0A8J2KRS9_9HEXA|nr:unnamed protein product [Allacma fusca]
MDNPNNGNYEDCETGSHTPDQSNIPKDQSSLVKHLEGTQPRNAVVTDSEGDFILDEDLNTDWQRMMLELFGDMFLRQDDRQPSSEFNPSAVSFPSHTSTSTNNLIQLNDNTTSCGLGKLDSCDERQHDPSLYSESVESKICNDPQEFAVYAEGNDPRNPYPKKASGGKRTLFVDNKEGEDIWEKYEFHWRALEKRMTRNNQDALDVLKKIQSAPNSKAVLDDFDSRERYYRRKHLLSWQAAIEMPRSKKIPFETQIPLAATRHLGKRLPKWERLRRRIIKVFACGSNRFYVDEVLTQLSIDNFNAKYNAMKASTILPGFGLQKRITLFMMRHPKMIERDEIMNYSYGDYIRDNNNLHSHIYFTDGGKSPNL